MSNLKLVIIGAGHLGRIHTRLAKQLAGVDVVAVADPVAAAREHVEREFGVRTVDDYRTLFGQIDAAILATPTSMHHAMGLELLENNIHLFVEKPLAANLQEASELVATARARERLLQVGHVERFNPVLLPIWPYVRQPKYIEAVRTSGYSFRSTDIGAVLDIMIHDLDIVLALVRSEILEVQALGISVFGGHEDIAQARLTFANGCVANLWASRASFETRRTMQVFSERSYAWMDFNAKKVKLVEPSPAVLRREIDFESLAAAEKTRLKEKMFEEMLVLSEPAVEDRNAIADEQQDFVSSIRERRLPRVTGQHGRDAIAAADQILAAIAAHRWTGASNGPIGPLATPEIPEVLRGPHWPHPADVPSHRRAG